MNPDLQYQSDIRGNPGFLSWQNGGIELSQAISTAYLQGSSFRENGYREKGYSLNSGEAFTQLELIFKFALNGLEAVRLMIPSIRDILDAFSEAENQPSRQYWASRLDLVLEQLSEMAQDSEIGGVNLIHNKKSRLQIPYFVTDIRSDGGHYNFATVGISISPIHETLKDGSPRFIGIFILSTSESGSVFWLSSLNVWMENQLESDWDDEALKQEVNQLRERLDQMENMLNHMESQFHEYMKMVGEVITDLTVNS
jgi:hypothetical protein